ncbi:hypothetical protein [Agromyces albus]|uniref:hypothetical protein n=1 Tax=Agromyces albus TaxID=205332 RepID=UPI002781ED31|nr:hypothetical protein [Agromyces albus]MDQ0574854.1 hypothetical protein [Agromyces albus]
MNIRTRSRTRLGLGLSTGVVIATLSLVLVPLTAHAEESPAEPVVETAVVEPAVPEAEAEPAPEAAEPVAEPPEETSVPAEPVPAESTLPDPVPVAAEVVVAEPGASVEETLAEPVGEPTVTLFAAADDPAVAAVPAPGDPCYPAVCITNGTVLLAVNPTGELNTSDATGSAAGPGDAGLTYVPTGNDGTSPGCLCEGWGVADPASGVWGGANLDTEGAGGTNLVVESFEYTGSTATSVVVIEDAADEPVFRVTHEYVPSAATPNLYQVNVTIENLSGAAIATVQYRRVMDWDIEPTAFDEFVTIDGGTASALFFSSDDGFASPNPLTGPSQILFSGNATDAGPDDIGALFDFAFGPIGPGGSISFVIFYGAAASEAEANAALAAVGAEAYSFGQTADDPAGGAPNTFIFAFGKIGGAPIFPADTPTTPPTAPAPAVVTTAAAGAAASIGSAPSLASTGVDASSVAWIALAALVLGGVAIAVARTRMRQA